MKTLENLSQHRVFYYFEELCNIPHGSGNVELISDYLVSFAQSHNLKYVQDEARNVVIYKNASPGYESLPGIIIQGHMDMVAVCDSDYDGDMKTDGLKLAVDGDYLFAEKTTLGADDGIAVAMALALLESDSIPHPSLEVIITTDEETGMEGAQTLDPTLIHFNQMINIDNEKEGQIITGCAGGIRTNIEYPINKSSLGKDYNHIVTINVNKCRGGHSGAEIQNGQANAIAVLGRMMYELSLKTEGMVRLINIQGGVADNAIPTDANSMIAVKLGDNMTNDTLSYLNQKASDIMKEYSSADPNMIITISLDQETGKNDVAVSETDTKQFIDLLYAVPTGVQAMSMDVPGLVETSLNLGIVQINENTITISFLIRSSIETAKYSMADRLKALATLAGAKTKAFGDYPGWKYRVDSPLREKMISIYNKMYSEIPTVEAIHAGLECGFFAGKVDDLDCVSIGPDIFDIHTTSERLSISSTERTWEYLCEILKQCE